MISALALLRGCRRSDPNGDGAVNGLDLEILNAAFGSCDLCGADLSDDGVVDDADRQILEGFVGCVS
jgi:hypothetical protein